MDKKKLNEEIILCRSLVKRAKVCVIRKLIKQIKLLRSCKKEELREKKLRKGRRLAAEVHMMKTLRPDYVTKFALLTENYVPTGSNTKLKRKRNACAKLVKHKDLVARINSIRDKFSDWREELPPLLESSKKKKTEDEEANTESTAPDNVNISDKVTVDEEELSSEELNGSQNSGSEDESEVTKPEKKLEVKQKDTKTKPKSESSKAVKPKTQSNKGVKSKKKAKKKKVHDSDDDDDGVDDDTKNNGSDDEKFEEKVEDPFFIGKKVTVPKLLRQGNENDPENERKETKPKLRKDSGDFKPRRESESDGNRKRPNTKRVESITEDELHPSWKAKKIQMIKPFQGKKIKFE